MAINSPKPANPVDHRQNRESIGVFYRRLRTKLTIGLLAVFTLPYAVLILFFNFQFTNVLHETGKLHLVSLSESQRNTVDLFLQERVINLFNLFQGPSFRSHPTQVDMNNLMNYLRQINDTFVDLGFLNDQGIQIGYAGPHLGLLNKDYSDEHWYKTIMSQEKNYLITDIYLGFRNRPHLTIAVKQAVDGRSYIMRSTIDPDKFYEFLTTVNRTQGVESMLINRIGIYQVVGPNIGQPFQRSHYVPDRAKTSGIVELAKSGDIVLLAHSWLNEVDWALLVRQPQGIAYAKMHQTRQIITAILLLLLMVFAVVIYFTTNKLIHYAWDASEKQDEMRLQLVHATKLASIGELSAGVAHEINNPLAIITANSGVVRDFLNPEFQLEWANEDILGELDSLDNAVQRIKGITSKLLAFGRKSDPKPVYSDINHVLNDVINGLIEREFKVIDISIVRDYDPEIPKIPIDPDQISQVFLNLINNARDAIAGPGTITISTHHDDRNVRITVTDTGIGMSIDQLKQIFNPFFTTKEVGKGTGLGLGISLNLVESMGGTIDVQSMVGKGSSFMVTLPVSDNKAATSA